jgi:molybdate transport system permease protein
MDWEALWLTARLAALVAAILLLVSLPLAYWITFSRHRWTFLVESVVSLPLVLPPTVLGFYLLVSFGAQSPLGQLWTAWTGRSLAFTFEGLVVASLIYSLPFAVQPIAAAFSQVDPTLREASATLGASPLRTFLRVVLPLSKQGVLTGVILSFAHTVGEFGVVLMVGGNLPGITRTVSISIYDQVQTLQYSEANRTALLLLVFSFAVLLVVHGLRRRPLAAAPMA